MDPTTLQVSNSIADLNSISSIDMEIAAADIKIWVDLFHYNDHDARIAILAHRMDSSAHVSDEKWRWVQWGHEKAGFNKEAYEHLLVLKRLSEKEKVCKAKGVPLFEWVGDYSRICLEGFLTLDILRRILSISDEEIGTIDSAEKWCYIKHNTYHEEHLSAWVRRWDRAVTAARRAYNAVWKVAIEEQTEATTLARAGFHAVQSSIQPDDRNVDIRAEFALLDGEHSTSQLEQNSVHGMQIRNLSTPSRWRQLQAQLIRLRPSLPFRALPPQRRLPGSLEPVLDPWSQVGVRSFWQRYRRDPAIRLPEFGNAPRVFPLPGEVATARREVSRVSRSDTILDTTATTQGTPPPYRESHGFLTGTSMRFAEPYYWLAATSRPLARQRAQMERPRSRTHRMEQLFGDMYPQTVSDMITREVVVANSLKMEDAFADVEPAPEASTRREWPEVWSK
ncbi:hypothetical protein ONS95_004333 [Cadophora gregata]|uniref:uncharacterized protein n=1 Tax=Cadophora gregata TaxID=51156 RepID=UPI0026DCFEC3|nr:uncharacterized protein ONS95_004333 [Cadophora gregata]KAK0105282.1 hypothetical protein ONS96_004678 [Cadophora gregata f. sp. sojae]KAK0105817.1 hypothetical protein ONS95_004333 [Cadophora gregata]